LATISVGIAFVALLVLPLVGPDAPFDIDLATLLQVLAGRFGQLAKENDPVPFGVLLVFARRLVANPVGGRNPDVADSIAARQVAGFRISAPDCRRESLY
jgi:hypothetical protein